MRRYSGYILVVDDFELNRDMLSRRLGTRGFRVDTAAGGEEALAMVMPRNYDLVLLDIMMPDIDGYEILEQIRRHFSSADLAVIMVTAKDQSEDIVRALNLGADDYITKPIDFQVALARIHNQLVRRKAELALKESEERYALAAYGANDGLWDWDLRTGRVYYSERWKEMIGRNDENFDPIIESWFDLVHPDDLMRLKAEAERNLQGESSKIACEYRLKMPDGTWRWLLTRGSAVRDHNGKNYRMVGWQTDSNERVEHDHLTNLPNRGLFLDRLLWASHKGNRSKDENFAVFYMGLDRFKVINETMGHESGDQVLCEVADRINGLIRPEDTLARMGGDEFALLSECLEGLGTATNIAERIRSAMADPFVVRGQEFHVTLSIGIVPGGGDHNEGELLRMAHSAMELAKNNGKDHYEYYREGMDAGQIHTLQMETNLRKALDQNELFLVYQPQISTRTGSIVGMEALIRWRKADGDIVPPFRFIPLAEETGLIEPIGAWVIHEACHQAKAWEDEGLPMARVAVNVSSRQFRQPERLLQAVKSALADSGLEPKWLDLELTESLFADDINITTEYLNRFHELGVHLSLDDFGTGYSSLSYLKKLPIDTLKIDQSFVRDITEDPDDAAICSAIISMAHSLRLSVIAEGVETEDHLKFLKDLDCDEMQGYHFSKPLPVEEARRLLSQNLIFIQ